MTTCPERSLTDQIFQSLQSVPNKGAAGLVMSTGTFDALRRAAGVNDFLHARQSEPNTYMGLPIRHSPDLPPPWRNGTVTAFDRNQFQRFGHLIAEVEARRRPVPEIWRDMIKIAQEGKQEPERTGNNSAVVTAGEVTVCDKVPQPFRPKAA